MNRVMQQLTGVTLSLITTAALAMPTNMIIHNRTDFESNAYIAGTIPSHMPSRPNADNKVPWIAVQIACYGRTPNDICHAMIKMATNTKLPIDLGNVYLHMKTGAITPTEVSGNGFTFTVNGPGEATITKNS